MLKDKKLLSEECIQTEFQQFNSSSSPSTTLSSKYSKDQASFNPNSLNSSLQVSKVSCSVKDSLSSSHSEVNKTSSSISFQTSTIPSKFQFLNTWGILLESYYTVLMRNQKYIFSCLTSGVVLALILMLFRGSTIFLSGWRKSIKMRITRTLKLLQMGLQVGWDESFK